MGAITFASAAALMGVVFAASVLAPHRLPIETIYTSWAFGYASVDDLGAHSDLVVVGDVTGVKSQGADLLSPSVAATRFVLSVDRFIKGTDAKSIVVKQTGGRLGNVEQIVEDDPLMAVGQRYLLFLSRVPDGPYVGDYFVVGGPQGRFGVGVRGQLNPFGSVLVPVGATADSLSLGN